MSNLQWVKASDRNPSKFGQYYVQYSGDIYGKGKKDIFTFNGNEWHVGPYKVEYWLDEETESPSSIEGGEKGAEFVKLLEWMQDIMIEADSGRQWVDFRTSPGPRYTSAELVDKYLSSHALPIKEEEKLSNTVKRRLAQLDGFDDFLKLIRLHTIKNALGVPIYAPPT